jgi:opacity protein-like surface antigen
MDNRVRAATRGLLAACITLVSSAAQAQGPEASGNGFLFGAPKGSLSLRAGYAAASAGSDIFSFVTRELSLRRGDFSSFAVGGDVAISLRPRLDLVVSYDADGMEKQSDYREWQDNSGKPIEQTTAFSRQTYLVSAKYYLMAPGRSLGRFAWVPARYAPWVSAGVGRIYYSLSQNGDFVDFDNGNKVFHDAFRSSQWGTSGQLSAGVDWSVNQRWALTSQARYLLGKADLRNDYSGFEPIDLSGLGLSAGLTLRF